MVKMKAVTDDYIQKIAEAKVILGRLHKGQQVLEQAYNERSVATAFQAVNLFNQLSKEMFARLEECLFIHEYLAMGKTIVIKRDGQAINIGPSVERGEIEIDPWTLQTLVAMKEVFGDDFHRVVEFKDLERGNQ